MLMLITAKMRKIVKSVGADERGGMLEWLVTVLGGAVVAALVIVVIISLAKGTATSLWGEITTWIQSTLGF
jgi:hypothetical protein